MHVARTAATTGSTAVASEARLASTRPRASKNRNCASAIVSAPKTKISPHTAVLVGISTGPEMTGNAMASRAVAPSVL